MPIVRVESVLWLNPNLRKERVIRKMPPGYQKINVSVPGEVGRGVQPIVYSKYRSGLDGACADIVVTTMNTRGEPAVVATRRAEDKCFGGVWWMQGGATHSYRPYREFVAERAAKECGTTPIVEGLIGIFRTCAEDVYASTFQPCYVGWVSPEKLVALATDHDHRGLRLLTLDDLDALPEKEKHWYPALVFRQALTTMPFHWRDRVKLAFGRVMKFLLDNFI